MAISCMTTAKPADLVVPQSQEMQVATSTVDKGAQCSRPGCAQQATQADLMSFSSVGSQTEARFPGSTARTSHGPAVSSFSRPPGVPAASRKHEATSARGSPVGQRDCTTKQCIKSRVVPRRHVERDGAPPKRTKTVPPKRTKTVSAVSLLEQRTAMLTRLAQCIKTPAAPDGCAAFGVVIAGYLRRMPVMQRAHCQTAVMSVIMKHLAK